MRQPVILLVVLVLLCACTELGAGTGQVSKRIGEITHDPTAKEIDLSKVMSFGWDHFYYFKPGTTREEVCKFIGADRNTCGRIIRYEKVPGDHMALLFGLNGALTHSELHALANGEFEMPLGEEGHPKSRSVFNIRRLSVGTAQDRIVLEPK